MKTIFAVFSVLLVSGLIYGKTPVFFPEQFNDIYAISIGDDSRVSLENIWLNPAQTSTLKGTQVGIYANKHPFSYSSHSLSTAFPFGKMVMGAGVYLYQSDDIFEVSEEVFQPQVVGSHRDMYLRTAFTLATQQGQWQVGMKTQALYRELVGSKALGASLDFGVARYLTKKLNMSLYTNNFLQMPLKWSGGHIDDPFSRQFTSRFTYAMGDWTPYLALNWDEFEEISVSLGTHSSLSEYLDLFGGLNISEQYGLNYWTLGTRLFVSSFQLTYMYSDMNREGLQEQEHYLGVVYSL